MSICDFKLVIEELDGPKYAPFWPFRRRREHVIRVHGSFKATLYQKDAGGLLTADGIELQGYKSSDGQTRTTTIDFNGGSRLKRVTGGQ